MNLLSTDKEEMLIFNPEIRAIKEFNRIIVRDRGSEGDSQGRKKKQAIKELAFIHFYYHWKSPYQIHGTPEFEGDVDPRKLKLMHDLELAEDWDIDDELEEAINKYKELIKTPSLQFLEDARIGANALSKYLRTVNLNLTDAKGQLVNKPDMVARTLTQVGIIVENMQKVEDRVKAELAASGTRVMGGGKVGNREDPE